MSESFSSAEWSDKMLQSAYDTACKSLPESISPASLYDVRFGGREAGIVAMRKAIAYILRMNGLSYLRIGMLMGRKHCAALYYVRSFEEMRDFPPVDKYQRMVSLWYMRISGDTAGLSKESRIQGKIKDLERIIKYHKSVIAEVEIRIQGLLTQET
jgi:hypothetical protein